MTHKTFLSIGECMIEMSSADGRAFRLGYAGDTLNTAWYARASLSEDWHVSYLTRVGTDPYSAEMLAFLRDNRIGTEHVTTDPERRPGLYMIQLDEGERTFTYWRDQSAARRLADDEAALAKAMDGADAIYFSGITIAILDEDARARFMRAVARARAAGRLIIFDPNLRPRLWQRMDDMRRATMEAASVADIALPSFDDEAQVFGDADLAGCANRYAAVACGTVIVKNGGGEMFGLSSGVASRFDGLPRLRPLDSTGAGDAFNGVFAARLLAGYTIAESVTAAHRASSQVIMHPGALIPMDRLNA